MTSVVVNEGSARSRELVLFKKTIGVTLEKLELLEPPCFLKKNELWNDGFSHFGNED